MSTRNEATAMPAIDERSLVDWIKLIVGVTGVAALIVFVIQNRQEVDVEFLWMEWSTGLIWALLASAILGALSAAAFSTIRGRAIRNAAKR
ncbi:MAG: lipopolysaccharide assembly protein LapA domain-containing protein [Dehalococcoidia bacterium]